MLSKPKGLISLSDITIAYPYVWTSLEARCSQQCEHGLSNLKWSIDIARVSASFSRLKFALLEAA